VLEQGGYLHRRGALHLSQGDWPELPPGVDAHRIERAELEHRLPGVRPAWVRALVEPGCADIDVAALHAAYLRRFAQAGGTLATRSRLVAGRRDGENWRIELADGAGLIAPIVVNAAGAWADLVAEACSVAPLGLAPKRRTMVQLRVGRSGLKELPLVNDSAGQFYFKGEGDSSIWLSPHDEIPTDPCDAAPDEIDVATAIERFQGVVDWPVERVERKWAGLRTFAPDRLPILGFDRAARGFFWCAGQGGFGIQTSPAAASLCGTLLLENEAHGPMGGIDAAVFSPTRFGG
jgi:D-arginine dehydrogenase